MSEPLVVIGNGMAAARFVEELTARALGRYSIAVLGDEGKLAYNRVLLSSVLANEAELGDIELKSADWWEKRGVTLLYGKPAVAVDPSLRRVKLQGGEYRDRSGRIYPDCLHVWRGDFLRVRKGGASC